MKKILFLLSIILFSSCTIKNNNSDTNDDAPPYGFAGKFKYNKHTYIIFERTGAVHDPDCKCHFNKSNY